MEVEEQIDRIRAIVGDKIGFFHIEIKHDRDCPALRTHRMRDCTCTAEINAQKNNA